MNSILIVDDEIISLRYFKTAIQSDVNSDYIVFLANDAAKALEIVAEENIDLIITDWQMPDIDGIELTRQLKKMEKTKDTPIIICTAYNTSSENLKIALDAGAIDFLRKPINEIELMARINSLLQYSKSINDNLKQKDELLQNEKLIFEQNLELLNKERKMKDNVIVFKALQIMKLTDLIKKTSKEILDSTKDCPYSNICAASKIEIDIVKKINNPFWKEFETHLNNSHNDFYLKLEKLFPQLTVSEKRLCALIHIDLSSKEISHITDQTITTIDMARYRIRKKLNLNKNQNLNEFFIHLDKFD